MITDTSELLVWLFNEGNEGTLTERRGFFSLTPQVEGTKFGVVNGRKRCHSIPFGKLPQTHFVHSVVSIFHPLIQNHTFSFALEP